MARRRGLRRRRGRRKISPSLRIISCIARRKSSPGPRLARDAPVAAPLRQALGQSALKAAQRVGLVGGRETARGEGLGRRRGLARLVDVVGGRRLEAAAAVLLHPQLVRIGLADLAGKLDRTQEVRIEQRVELLAPLRRRRQSRMRGAADVVEAARAQQRDGRQEGRGLLGRHRKAVGAQQSGERDERLDGDAAALRGSCRNPRDDGVEPGRDVRVVLLVLDGDADRALEGVGP